MILWWRHQRGKRTARRLLLLDIGAKKGVRRTRSWHAFLFGLANQIALALIALALISIIVRGYQMWWQRRPTRTNQRLSVGAPPVRGTWRHLSIPALIGLAIAAIAIGWAIPLLGWTLLGFLIFDATAGLVRRRAWDPAVRHEEGAG